MRKHFCDCCGKEVNTWYVFSVRAECECDQLGRGTAESLAHSIRSAFKSQRIFCAECKDRAMKALEPPKEE